MGAALLKNLKGCVEGEGWLRLEEKFRLASGRRTFTVCAPVHLSTARRQSLLTHAVTMMVMVEIGQSPAADSSTTSTSSSSVTTTTTTTPISTTTTTTTACYPIDGESHPAAAALLETMAEGGQMLVVVVVAVVVTVAAAQEVHGEDDEGQQHAHTGHRHGDVDGVDDAA